MTPTLTASPTLSPSATASPAANAVRVSLSSGIQHVSVIPGATSSGAAGVDGRVGPADHVLSSMLEVQQPRFVTRRSPLVLSHLTTPEGLQVLLRVPAEPGPNEVVTIQCAAVNSTVGVQPPRWRMATTSFAPLAGAGVIPYEAQVALVLTPKVPIASGEQAPSPHKETVDVVRCTVESQLVTAPAGQALSTLQVYAGSPPVSIHVTQPPVVWPFIGDVVTHLAGELTSSWTSQVPLLQHPGWLSSPAGLADAEYAQVLHAARPPPRVPMAQGPGSLFLAQARPGADSYLSVTLAGGMNITLVADGTQRVRIAPAPGVEDVREHNGATAAHASAFAFMPGSQVWLGQLKLHVNRVSSDGLMLDVALPPYAQLCPPDAPCTGPSAYKTLWVSNPPRVPQSWVATVRDAWAGAGSAWVTPHSHPAAFANGQAAWDAPTAVTLGHQEDILGGAMACPLACPGAGSSTDPTSPATARRLQSAEAASTGYGIYVTDACLGYLPPGPACRDPAISPARCAFGAGDECVPCGEGAVCPGGYRRWPIAGYWTDSERSGAGVVKCAAPAQLRCQGWDVVQRKSLCGEGYTGVRCGSCADSFYRVDSGECLRCPETGHNKLLDAIVPLLVFLGVFCGVVGVMTAAVLLAVYWRGGSLKGGLWRTLDFMAWAIALLQVLAQVGRSAAPGLPGFLADFYANLNVMQLDTGGLVPPECIQRSSVLSGDVLLMCAALAGMLFSVVLSAAKVAKTQKLASSQPPTQASCCSSCMGVWASIKPSLRHGVLLLLTVLYALVCNTVFRQLHCLPTEVSDEAGGSGDVLTSRTAYLLFSDPGTECFVSSNHVISGSLAVVTLVLFVIGYPLWSFLWVRRRIHSVMKRSKASAEYLRLCRTLARQRRIKASVAGKRGLRVLKSMKDLDKDEVEHVIASVTGDVAAPTASGDHYASASAAQYKQAIAGQSFAGMEAVRARTKLARDNAKAAQLQEDGETPSTKASPSKPLLVPAKGALLPGEGSTASHPARPSSKALLNPMFRKKAADGGAMQPVLRPAPQAPPPTPRRSNGAACVYYLACGCCCGPALAAKAGFLSRKANKLRLAWSTRHQRGSPAERYLAQTLERSPELINTMGLSHFTNADYRVTHWYFRHLEFAVMVVLACAFVFLPGNGAGEAGGRLALTLIALLAQTAALIWARPFRAEGQWKQLVKVYSLLLACLSALLNYAMYQELETGQAPLGPGGAANLAFLVFALSMGLLLTLLVSFWYMLLQGAGQEARAMRLQQALRRKGVQDIPTAAQITYATGNPLAAAVGEGTDTPVRQDLSMRSGGGQPVASRTSQRGLDGIHAGRGLHKDGRKSFARVRLAVRGTGVGAEKQEGSKPATQEASRKASVSVTPGSTRQLQSALEVYAAQALASRGRRSASVTSRKPGPSPTNRTKRRAASRGIL